MGSGGTYGAALKEAQRLHIAEAEPSLDVDGWDTAFKLIIIANSILKVPLKLEGVSVEGIQGVSPALIEEASKDGQVYKLVATALLKENGEYSFDVKPKRVKKESFVGTISREISLQKAVVATLN